MLLLLVYFWVTKFGFYLVYCKKKRQKNYLWLHLLLVFEPSFLFFPLDVEGFELMTWKREELALTIIPTELFSLPCQVMFHFLSYRTVSFLIHWHLQMELKQKYSNMYQSRSCSICNLKTEISHSIISHLRAFHEL